jgi:NAD(P)-dependent dehydrogenase (short-subunit alcohol dehydrogenase family)
MCREVLGLWTKNRQAGVILNTGSVLAQHPQREHFATAGYAASKGAVEAMSVAAAAYYAPAGIRINVIAPGLVHTPMTARVQGSTDINKYMVHKQPLRKGMLTAEDIAKTACFLLRKDSSPITGQILTVDAGWAVSE